MPETTPQRIAIIGNAGGGKSRLARHLSRLYALPLHTIDNIQWQPGWVRTPLEDLDRIHQGWLAGSAWVIDGWGTPEMITARFHLADTIIFIDYPFWRHVSWALKRQVLAVIGHAPHWPPPGCPALPKTIHLLRMMWRINFNILADLLSEIESFRPAARVLHLRHPRQLNALLASGIAE